jgi:hypothetical protein
MIRGKNDVRVERVEHVVDIYKGTRTLCVVFWKVKGKITFSTDTCIYSNAII